MVDPGGVLGFLGAAEGVILLDADDSVVGGSEEAVGLLNEGILGMVIR